MPENRPFVTYGDAMPIDRKPEENDDGGAKMLCHDCPTIGECKKLGRCKRVIVPAKPMIDK